MENAQIRFGLIGFGAWGRCHAEAISKTAGAQLTAISARSQATCAAARQAYPQATVYNDYQRMLAEERLDAVDIVLPSHLHHEVAAAALSSGRHLLLEKPMALSVEACDELIQLARQKDRLLAVGHELRLSSLFGKAKQLIDSDFVGQPQYVLVELSRHPYRQGADNWRYDIDRVGSWVLEEPIHFFDLARWYLESVGQPQTVYATANARRPDSPELHDNFSAIVRFPHNAYAVVSQTLSAFEHHQTVKITGAQGALWASWSGATDRTPHPTFRLRAFDGTETRDVGIEKPAGELFELEDQVAAFVAALRDGKPLACSGEDGRWSVAMCLAAERSVETNQPVSLRPPEF